jgi:putative chitinase
VTYATPVAVAAGLRALGVAAPMVWAPPVAVACAAHGIDTIGRLAPFLATISHETGKLASLVENLDYSVAGILGTFGRHRISEADAQRIGRKPGERILPVGRQQELANLVYGGAWGKLNLGNVHPNDGWYFRGRGGIQLTGRAHHKQFATIIGTDVVALQTLLAVPATAMQSAAQFWEQVGCNGAADDGDIPEVRRLVNGGTLGLLEVTQGTGVVQSALRRLVA